MRPTHSDNLSIASRSVLPHIAMILLLSAIFFISRMDFHLAMTADDVFFNHFEQPLRNLAIANRVNGRFVSGAFVHLFEFLNEWYFEFLYACKILTILLFSAFAYSFCYLLAGGASIIILLIASLIIILHPYNTTNFDNIINQPNMLFGIGAATLAIWVFARNKSRIRFGLCLVLLLIVASSYQTVAYYFFVFVVAHTLFHTKSEDEISQQLIAGIAISVSSVVAYFIIHKLLLPGALAAVRATGEPLMIQTFLTHRSGVKAPFDILQSFGTYGQQLIRSFAAPEPIFSTGPKVLVALALGSPILLWVLKQARKKNLFSPTTRWRIYLLMLLLLLCGSVMHIVLLESRIAPRSILHASTTMAAVFLFGYRYGETRFRKPAVVLGGTVAALMLWLTVDIAQNRQKIWARDLETLRTVTVTLQKHPEFSSELRISVVGALPEDDPFYLGDIKNYFDINASKLSATWSLIPMISFLGSAQYMPSLKSEKTNAFRRCLRAQPLSAPYEILFEKHSAIICLSLPGKPRPHL